MKDNTLREQTHNIAPVFDDRSRILVLGSFPSPASRREGFYYGNPANRFWRVMSAALGCDAPGSVEEKRAMLLGGGVALWDVIASCRIVGASDASIEDVVPNDLAIILGAADISRVVTNGAAAHRLYRRFQMESAGMEDVCLPSTSPANAAWSLEALTKVWTSAIKLV